ncbi:hypothetical protein BDQ17DRAFT_1470920 [Cyathus striatus]|nr:hypothetical protein BDQ17DRAFT_1470920 [Cyathus striatus]
MMDKITHTEAPDFDKRPELLSPFSLGAVCKKWREIAWTTPSIWTNISIFISRGTRYPIQVELLQGWLERARGLPLTIKLVWDLQLIFQLCLNDVEAERNDPTSIINLLFAHAKQWKAIDLLLEPNWYHHFEDCSYDFPLLESIAIRRPDVTIEPGWTRLDIFGRCPKLRELKIENFRSSDLGLVPWSSIQTLIVVGNTTEDTIRILSETKNVRLVYLSEITRESWIGSADEESITLPGLESFTITESASIDIRLLMNRLILPGAQIVQMATPRPEPNTLIDVRSENLPCNYSFGCWSKLWSSNLTTLNIEAILLSTVDILQGLAELKSLEKIALETFNYERLDVYLLARSLITTDFGQFPPNLRRFKYTGPISVNDEAIEMLEQALYFRRHLVIPFFMYDLEESEVQDPQQIQQLNQFLIRAPDSPPMRRRHRFDELSCLIEGGMCIHIHVSGIPWADCGERRGNITRCHL